jgi:hypothetical protein
VPEGRSEADRRGEEEHDHSAVDDHCRTVASELSAGRELGLRHEGRHGGEHRQREEGETTDEDAQAHPTHDGPVRRS